MFSGRLTDPDDILVVMPTHMSRNMKFCLTSEDNMALRGYHVPKSVKAHVPQTAI
jgi:hypothetical protein